MGAEGKLPPKQRTRKRSLAEPEAPARTHGRRGGRGGPPPLGQATPVDGDLAGRSPSRSRSSWTKGRPTPPPQAVHRMCSSAGWARPRHPGRQCTSAGTARSGSGAPAGWRSTSGSTPGTLPGMPPLFIARSAPVSSAARERQPCTSGATRARSCTLASCADTVQRQEQRCAARADPTPLTEIVERKGVKSNAPVIPAFNFYYLFIHTNFE